MHEIFWEHGVQELIESGTIIARPKRDKPHPNPFIDQRGNRIERTQEIFWHRASDGVEVMRSHQYINCHGQIGGSGYTDPKRILIGTDLYRQETTEQPCAICAGTTVKPIPVRS